MRNTENEILYPMGNLGLDNYIARPCPSSRTFYSYIWNYLLLKLIMRELWKNRWFWSNYYHFIAIRRIAN